MSEEMPQELKSPKAFGNTRTFTIKLPPTNSFPLTTEDLFKIIQILFDKVIKGTEESIEISMSSNALNFTIEATLSE